MRKNHTEYGFVVFPAPTTNEESVRTGGASKVLLEIFQHTVMPTQVEERQGSRRSFRTERRE